MTTLLLVCGSQRRESFNARLLDHLAERLHGRCTLDRLEPHQVSLPLFDQDREREPAMIRQVGGLLHRVQACDGLVVASPEYNGLPTPYLKNLVDWITRLPHVDGAYANPFVGRPVLLCSASTGRSGGAVALAHHRALFGYLGSTVIGESLCVPHMNELWAESGDGWARAFEHRIGACLARILSLAHGFAGARAEEARA